MVLIINYSAADDKVVNRKCLQCGIKGLTGTPESCPSGGATTPTACKDVKNRNCAVGGLDMKTAKPLDVFQACVGDVVSLAENHPHSYMALPLNLTQAIFSRYSAFPKVDVDSVDITGCLDFKDDNAHINGGICFCETDGCNKMNIVPTPKTPAKFSEEVNEENSEAAAATTTQGTPSKRKCYECGNILEGQKACDPKKNGPVKECSSRNCFSGTLHFDKKNLAIQGCIPDVHFKYKEFDSSDFLYSGNIKAKTGSISMDFAVCDQDKCNSLVQNNGVNSLFNAATILPLIILGLYLAH